MTRRESELLTDIRDFTILFYVILTKTGFAGPKSFRDFRETPPWSD